ncbi:UvrD-like DNA helicase C-terminal domain profile [Nakaseomyces glabratus]
MRKGKLTSSQKSVLEAKYEPNSTLKVVAGPGSGKTTTLLHKVHHLIDSQNIHPDEILILSLTNKAVDNIFGKLTSVFYELTDSDDAQHIEQVADKIGCYTIHGLANKIVTQREGTVSIIEENGWRGLSQLVSKDYWNKTRSPGKKTKRLEKLLSEYKKQNKSSDDTIDKLIQIMDSCKVLTNEDLIIRASKILTEPTFDSAEFSFIRDLNQRYKVILIDEFQDLYPQLLPLLQTISKNKQLIIFGDVHQSIYEFLGANSTVVEALDHLHSNTITVHLNDNFRCSPEIMKAARKVINKEHVAVELETISDIIVKEPSKVDPIIESIDNVDAQLRYIETEISKLVCSSAKLSDIAILTRSNAEIDTIIDYFKNSAIPFEKLTSQPEWMSDVRIQYIIDFMRTILLTSDDNNSNNNNYRPNERNCTPNWKSDFNTIVTLSGVKGIGYATIQQLYQSALSNEQPLWEYLKSLDAGDIPIAGHIKQQIQRYVGLLRELHRSSFVSSCNEPIELLEMLVNIISDIEYQPLINISKKDLDIVMKHLQDLLLALNEAKDSKPSDCSLLEWFLTHYIEQVTSAHHEKLLAGNKDDIGTIKLSTIHAAKGLEFPIVLISNLSQNQYPIDTNALYVAMTRARNLLYLINVNHKEIKNIDRFSHSILEQRNFWKYYNRDLKRTNIITTKSYYTELSKKYNLLPSKRMLHSAPKTFLRAAKFLF